MTDIKVLCFIPMRNCQSKIGPLLEKFRGEMLDYLNEILVVDNSSEDNSLDEARRGLSLIQGLKVTLLQNSRNYGLGGSHKIAFNYARENGYDYLFVVHGDGSADPNSFLPFLKRGLSSQEMILSDRLHGKAKGYPFHRLLFNRILSSFAGLVTFFPVKDFGGGPLNIYRVSSFLDRHENAIKTFSNQIEFSQYALLYGIFRRMKITFAPVDFEEHDHKDSWKLITQFLKPVKLLLKYRMCPRKTIASDLQGSFFGHTYLKVNVNPEAPILPPSPKPRNEKPEEAKLLDLKKMAAVTAPVPEITPVDFTGFEVLWVRMKLLPDHLNNGILEAHITEFLKHFAPERIILDINGDEVVKSKQCYDFLTFCLDRGIEPQLITNGVGDINLWRNYAKLVKNLTINYVPGEVQRTFFFELIKEVAPMGNISVNILTHKDYFYHSVGLKRLIETEVKCRSVLLQPYALESDENLPEDHLHVLLDQTAVIHTWFKNNVFRKHTVFSLGQALKDKDRYQKALTMGFMEMSTRKMTKDKVKTLYLEDFVAMMSKPQ